MDFSKIVSQRQSKTNAVDVDVTVAEGRAKPGPKPKATSKRNDPNWRAATVFLQEPTLERIKRFLNLRALLDDEKAKGRLPQDQSELIDLAVTQYLNVQLERLESKVMGR